MKYCGNLLAVRDMAASRAFYENLFSLDVESDYGRNLAFSCGLSLQSDFSWLANIPEESIRYESNNAELYFEEDDLDEFLARLTAAGARLLHGIKEQSWGQRGLRVYDPDGHIIEVGESLESVVVRLLKEGMRAEDVEKKSLQTPEFVARCQRLLTDN